MEAGKPATCIAASRATTWDCPVTHWACAWKQCIPFNCEMTSDSSMFDSTALNYDPTYDYWVGQNVLMLMNRTHMLWQMISSCKTHKKDNLYLPPFDQSNRLIPTCLCLAIYVLNDICTPVAYSLLASKVQVMCSHLNTTVAHQLLITLVICHISLITCWGSFFTCDWHSTVDNYCLDCMSDNSTS